MWPVDKVGTIPWRPGFGWTYGAWRQSLSLSSDFADSATFLRLLLATSQTDFLDMNCSALLTSHHPPSFSGLVSSLVCLVSRICREFATLLRTREFCRPGPWCPTFCEMALLQVHTVPGAILCFLLKNWRIVHLQCCIIFRCTVKWFTYTFFSFLDSFLL